MIDDINAIDQFLKYSWLKAEVLFTQFTHHRNNFGQCLLIVFLKYLIEYILEN